MLSFVVPAWQPAFAVRVAAALPRLSVETIGSDVSHRTDVIFHAQSIESTANAFEHAWPFVWLAGSAICLFLAMTGIVRQTRIGSRSVQVPDNAASSMLKKVLEQLRCNRTIRLKHSADDCM